MSLRVLPWLLLAVAIVALDQTTKVIAEHMLVLHRPVPVLPPVFDLMLTYNEGGAFSLLGDAGGWQRYFFITVAVSVSVGLVIWLSRLPAEDRLTAWAIALILGGAVGNLWDRMFRDGRVVDFIYLHYGDFHWPAFNLADSTICVGAGLLILLSLKAPPSQ